jgi:hypothetical protein
VQAYTYILFIDGARTGFAGAVCAGASQATGFDCSGPLPPLTPGRHVLEMSVVDARAGLESPRSSSLVLNIGSDGRPTALADERSGVAAVAAEPHVDAVPATVCAAGAQAVCFDVTTVAGNLGNIRRLLPLPDGRVAVLQEDGRFVMLPSGTVDQPHLGTRTGVEVLIADAAVDPDFSTTRFLYSAVRSTTTDGRRTVSVVRVRELGDVIGEPATIVPDLPLAPEGLPALTVGHDRRIYLAMPGRSEDPTGYGGRILRFTAEGRAGGTGPPGSPIAWQGPGRPSRIGWGGASRLVAASTEVNLLSTLWEVPLDDGLRDSPRVAPVSRDPTFALTRVLDFATVGSSESIATLVAIEADQRLLSLATIAFAGSPVLTSKQPIVLGGVRPNAVAVSANGDLFVGGERGGVHSTVLRLRRVAAPGTKVAP